MEVLLGKSKINGNGVTTKSLKTSIPLVVAENLHVTVGSELFLYLGDNKVYLETSKRDESSYGIGSNVCYLGSKTLVMSGSVLNFSFAHVLRDVLELSSGDYLGYYFDNGKIYIKKYDENF